LVASETTEPLLSSTKSVVTKPQSATSSSRSEQSCSDYSGTQPGMAGESPRHTVAGGGAVESPRHGLSNRYHSGASMIFDIKFAYNEIY